MFVSLCGWMLGVMSGSGPGVLQLVRWRVSPGLDLQTFAMFSQERALGRSLPVRVEGREGGAPAPHSAPGPGRLLLLLGEHQGCTAYMKWVQAIMWNIRDALPNLHLIPKPPVFWERLGARLRRREAGASITNSIVKDLERVPVWLRALNSGGAGFGPRILPRQACA